MQNNSVHLAVQLDKPESGAGDKYVAAERRLAELLDWENIRVIHDVEVHGCPPKMTLVPFANYHEEAPRWARSCVAALHLMVEHDIDIDWAIDVSAVRAYVNTNEGYLYREVAIADHFDKTAAVRYAIVQAVITKLESGINPKS